MNDLYFIDYEPRLMLVDAVGMRPDTELAHRRLCDILWAHGLAPKDDTETLSDIFRAKPQDYMRIRGELLQKGWLVENGLFTHKGCMKTLSRCQEKHAKKVASAKTASDARWNRPQSERNPDAYADAMRTDMRPESQLQPQPQLHSNTPVAPKGAGGESVELPVGFPSTIEEARVAAEFVGCPIEVADKAWNKAMSRGGRDSKDIPIRSWRSHLASEWSYEQARVNEKKQKTENGLPAVNRPAGAPKMTDVQAYAKDKWGDDDRHTNWSTSFFRHWNDAKRNWQRSGKLIDWKVELSKQVSTWRTQRS